MPNSPIKQAFACLAAGAVALLSVHAPAAVTDLATAPLETSTAALVKPNIFFILDDSGSMFWDFLPDWANASDTSLGRNAGYNGIYYDPGTTYTPPLRYDGSSYTAMTSANTSAWTRVPYDGFGVQSASNTPNTGVAQILTTTGSGSTQNLVSNAYYYAFIPGEYCTALNLKNCNTQTAASDTYPYAAGLRWCTNSNMTNCQAGRIDTAPSGGSTYLVARYPGQSATARITIGGSGSTSITGITVNGVQIMSDSTSNSTSNSTVASRVVDAINDCTDSATGNCGIAGYSASRSGSVITITTPASVGGITSTPGVTKSGNMSATATAFSGGTPGQNVLTTITSGVTSYSYPGTSAKGAGRTDCTGVTCTYAEEMTNYANWWAYYRTRMQMTKSAASLAFAVLNTSFRLGYMSINNNTGSDFLNVADITTTSSGQKANWYTKLTSATPTGGTPLRVSLSTAGRYYAGKLSRVNSVTATDPMQYACQRNYTILSTDGYWSDSATASTVTRVDGSTAIGDTDSGEVRPYYDGTSTANTLADVAQYYYSTDIRASGFSNTTGSLSTDVASNNVPDKQQRMYTYTVGLGASGYMQFQSDYATATSGDYYDVAQGTAASTTAASNGICSWQTSGSCNWPAPAANRQTTVDDLWHTAVNGRGQYYSAANPADLRNGLQRFLQDVSAQTANAAAAATSNPNVAAGDNYVFQSTFRSVAWYGELARYELNLTTGAISPTATWSQSGTVPSNNTTSPVTYTPPLLDNRNYATRSIYTFDPSNTTNTLLPFDWSSMPTAMQNYFRISSGAISSLSQLCSSGTSCLASTDQVDSSTSSSTGAGGLNLVNFLRGDRSREGSYYFQRTHVLGDIVDSQAVYVKAPLFSYTDTGYAAYKTSQASRQGMVYVGANDGMLHAFNADTGAESWAYIPSLLLPSLYKLADKNYSASHNYYINATPRQGDVYYDSGWHTILVGGLGSGGRGYYALDITDPATPKVLWEFSSDTSRTGLTTDADVGYAMGVPVITKLSDGTWAVIVSSGYNNVSPGSGRGIVWVLNAKTGAVIRKIDTGAGSSTAAVTGCTAAPCPSGLSKLSAYVDAATTNNRALRVYGGDLLGNLWRIDISALTGSGGTATTQLLATLSDANGTRQPITSRPELGNIGGVPVVFASTGLYLGLSDVSTVGVQTIYGIRDPLTTGSGALLGNPRASTCTATVKTNCFVRQVYTDSSNSRMAASSVSYSIDYSSMYGWYADLPETGERIDTDPELQLGTLVFTSNIPSSSSACNIGGSSYLNYVDYRTGGTVTGATTSGVLLSNGSTTALASSPTLIRLPSGKVVAITNLSDGSTVSINIPVRATNAGTRRVSWRELTVGQ